MNQFVAPIDLPDTGAARHWLARLSLTFARRGEQTKLVRARHEGPLVVQRPFYPEGGHCHAYLLHPPGGIAAGDRLRCTLALAQGTGALITTPSAGKVYATDGARHPQSQTVTAELADTACLEWLPQETIVFSGANIELCTRVRLHGGAKILGWDFVCLGRRASGEQFLQGDCTQRIELDRDGQPLLRERTHWRGGDPMLQSAWGMGGHVVSGTLYATVETSRGQVDAWREGLAVLQLPGEWGISQKPGVLLARYLGQSAARGRQGFEYLWACLRPLMNGREICRPRIWKT